MLDSCRETSKIEMTTSSERLRLHAPASVVEMLKATQYYVSSSDSIVMRSDKFPQKGANRDDCFKKLCNIFLKAGEDAAKKEHSKGPLKMLSVMRWTFIYSLCSLVSFSVQRSLPTNGIPAELGDNTGTRSEWYERKSMRSSQRPKWPRRSW